MHVKYSIAIIVVAFIVVILASCGFAAGMGSQGSQSSEPFSNNPICLPGNKCPQWIYEQVNGLINLDPQFISSYVDPSEIERFQHVALEHTITNLWTQKNWVIFYDQSSFKGKMYLLPANKTGEWVFDKNEKNKSLSHFIKDFKFYYGRKFSVYVPEKTKVLMKPIKGGSYPDETLDVGPGLYESIQYFKGPIDEFSIVVA